MPTTTSSLNAVVLDVCQQFSQEGLRFEILSATDQAAHVRLHFDGVDCEECVMPSEHLERMIALSLQRRTGLSWKVTLDDPRRPVVALGTGSRQAGRLVVLDPTARAKGGDMDPGPDAGTLAGKSVLIRIDALWRSWDWVVDEWTRQLEQAGATVARFRRWQGLTGDEGEAAQREYETLVADADVVVSGLANCGSCSAWTVRDALTALSTGLPTVAVATEHFVPMAKLFAEDGGRPGLRLVTLPYPLDTRPRAEVTEIARAEFPNLLATLGAAV